MKLKKTLYAVIAAVLLLCMLTACAASEKDPYEGLKLYENPVGISLYMEEGFTETEVEGLLACYEGELSNVRIEKEPFAELEEYGYGGEMTEKEYGELIKETYGLDGEVTTDNYGSTYIKYNVDVQGHDVAYYAFYHKGTDAYWTVTFMCFEELAKDMEDDFRLWAGSVKTWEVEADGMAADDAQNDPPEDPGPQKEELTGEEMEDLVEIIEKIQPADWFGKSFRPEELTNDEMLRLSYFVFGAQQYGIVGTGGEYFRDNIALKYFGYEILEDKDMICSCGATLAKYDAEEDQYNWDTNFHHYEAHGSSAYNEYADMYKLGELYYVETYKVFSDLMENTDPAAINFYATYENAENRQNILFTAGTEDEFTAGIEALSEEQKVLHTYVFEKDGEDRFVLAEYIINS